MANPEPVSRPRRRRTGQSPEQEGRNVSRLEALLGKAFEEEGSDPRVAGLIAATTGLTGPLVPVEEAAALAGCSAAQAHDLIGAAWASPPRNPDLIGLLTDARDALRSALPLRSADAGRMLSRRFGVPGTAWPRGFPDLCALMGIACGFRIIPNPDRTPDRDLREQGSTGPDGGPDPLSTGDDILVPGWGDPLGAPAVRDMVAQALKAGAACPEAIAPGPAVDTLVAALDLSGAVDWMSPDRRGWFAVRGSLTWLDRALLCVFSVSPSIELIQLDQAVRRAARTRGGDPDRTALAGFLTRVGASVEGDRATHPCPPLTETVLSRHELWLVGRVRALGGTASRDQLMRESLREGLASSRVPALLSGSPVLFPAAMGLYTLVGELPPPSPPAYFRRDPAVQVEWRSESAVRIRRTVNASVLAGGRMPLPREAMGILAGPFSGQVGAVSFQAHVGPGMVNGLRPLYRETSLLPGDIIELDFDLDSRQIRLASEPLRLGSIEAGAALSRAA